ncbi:hypothetical protein SFC88_12430 [Nocardioides sp. HM23]|uniref:hypothetical protein n=1 Tax=Nocardioides bizhenqiangii TaxID=3095076 RepID=UPI002ACA1822|nr:hypothetical protein [Nocardioides sp. HM23]MDZ5621642.1 hypothetical protein [Nocardioides sp. HM23]
MHDIAHAAADAAAVPSFDDVLARGRQQRNRRHALTVGTAGLAVAAIVGGVQLLGPGESTAPQPAPSSPTTVIEDDPSTGSALDRFVDAPSAFIGDAAVTEDGATAVFWRTADREQSGLAVSADGYGTRHLARLPIPGEVSAAGDRFLVRDEAMSELWVAGAGGKWTRVEVAGAEAPVADGEFPVAMSDGLFAVDPATATAHPVPNPAGLYDVEFYGGRLSAISTHVSGGEVDETTYHWSDDGGASWYSATFEMAWDSLNHVVPTKAGASHVIAVSTGRKPIKPLGSVLTLPADGGAFTETAYDGELATVSAAWTVDGEIRFLGDLWGDERPRESGVYRWAEGRLELVPSSAPEATDADDSTLVDVVDTDGGPTLLVAVDDRLFSSTDGGATWQAIAAR